MFISLDWISDFVDLDGLDVKTIVSRLTMATAEVEDFVEVRRFVRGVVIGRVTACERIDEKRTFCTVDCGSKTYTTVCGAPNARVGLVAPFAPVGTVLANNLIIEPSVVAGHQSDGMLCSADELGMSQWHEIVFEIPDDASLIGKPLSDFIPDTDTLIEIDNKSLTHRPDLWGHYGFAREFAAIFRRPLKPLPLHNLDQYDRLPPYPIKIDDIENCPCYGCIEFNANLLSPSPLVMQRRLHALGQRTYNIGVDVTNYVNLEIAQPTHAFDADLIGSIRVGQAGENREFTTLDGQQRKMLPEDLMIWGSGSPSDKQTFRPVAIAGIMGGLETEVTPKTQKMLLESANFRAARIRRTSTRLDLRTDASQRYEKSQPPSNVKVGTSRILALFEQAGLKFEVLSRFTLDGDLRDGQRKIVLKPNQLERSAGINLPREQVLDILTRLGFAAAYAADNSLTVVVPPYRSEKDISIPEDIIEEILRVYGFDNIPPVMPLMPLRPLFIETAIKHEHKIQRLLTASYRFLEVHNYCWMNDNWLKSLGYEPVETLQLKNPVTPWESRLRTSLMPNLLALVTKNRPYRDSFRLLEIGHVFFPVESDDVSKNCDEQTWLSAVSYVQASGNAEQDYLEIKSAVEGIGKIFGKDVRFVTQQKTVTAWQQAGHWVKIFFDDAEVGSLGVLDKAALRIVIPEGGRVAWFELKLQKIDAELFTTTKFIEPPRYPISWQDFSLLWKIDDGFDKLSNTLDKFKHELLRGREFLTSYKGKGIESGMASYSFRYLISAPDHTLTGEEIENFHKKFLQFLKENSIAMRV
ncbi:MAG: phenylalanine--tRNA ligase subunit beta [Planctomycetaceae bacterium]|jgi:phenylalanyl-tRNA synthetase beta chain|nr:phenylalanine--tRNA ligase subunit beta [Planctomycetaceae bacterium]